MREDNGRGRGLGVGDDRFFTPLRYVQNDKWGGAAPGGGGCAEG